MEEKRWDMPLWNIVFIVVSTAISFTIGALADITGAGMAAIFMYWFPVLLGIVGIILYLLSRLFFKKYNWVISVLFVLFMLTFSTQLHFADFG